MLRIFCIFGTRPEAIKLAPVILELQNHPARVQTRVCVTAQHREMLDQVLGTFGIIPDIDLNLMQEDQELPELTARVLTRVSEALAAERPDLVLVQGDTTTVMAAALAAFYQRIAVGHVEAGLRSGNRHLPFPEEINRRLTSALASYHFAPAETARAALLREGVAPSTIFVTGNPVIDALRTVLSRPTPALTRHLLDQAGVKSASNSGRRLVLVTAHRHENFGERFEGICQGLRTLAERNRDVVLIYPVHPNPNVQEPARRILSGHERIVLAEPLPYDAMAHLLNAAYVVLTDSGGLQEEAPALGKPVLVMRTETERPEAVQAGSVRLVGPDAAQIVAATERLLNDREAYNAMAQVSSPYGDGHAAKRIVEIILNQVDLKRA